MLSNQIPPSTLSFEQNAAQARFSNIVSHPFALGAIEESRAFVSGLTRYNQGASSLVLCDKETTHELIDVKPLDSFAITMVDFIKADVEGMELMLLMGAEETINRSKSTIFLEVNSLEASFGIFEWARQRKYLPYGLISSAFNPHNFNQESANMFGNAKECGLLLVHEEKVGARLSCINRLNMPEIKTTDDLVLLLLHKPQYPDEVLAKTAAARKLGIDYPAPVLKKFEERNAELSEVVADYEQKAIALQTQVIDYEQKTIALQTQVTNRDEQITRIISSRSWRITRPLRFLGRMSSIFFDSIKNAIRFERRA